MSDAGISAATPLMVLHQKTAVIIWKFDGVKLHWMGAKELPAVAFKMGDDRELAALAVAAVRACANAPVLVPSDCLDTVLVFFIAHLPIGKLQVSAWFSILPVLVGGVHATCVGVADDVTAAV